MALRCPPCGRPVPHFSSGPCAKRPGWSLQALTDAVLGRSHRSKIGKAKLKRAIDLTREILEVPADYRIGIVPASDTGAVEMALWSLLGARPVTMLAWESFGEGWVTDVAKQLKLKDATRPQGRLWRAARPRPGRFRDRRGLHLERHHLGRARAECRLDPGRPAGPDDLRRDLRLLRAGRSISSKLDVVTFSWQKVLGGEGAHGMLILSPRAVERLKSYTPPWPLPKIFRLTNNGKLIEGIFEGETINTPSMLCVEDYLDALGLGEVGRRPQGADRALRRQRQGDRRLGRAHALDRFPRQGSGDPLQHLGLPEGRRSRGARRFRPMRRRRSSRTSPPRSRRKASPTTSTPIATRRRACASGAARRSRRATSRR